MPTLPAALKDPLPETSSTDEQPELSSSRNAGWVVMLSSVRSSSASPPGRERCRGFRRNQSFSAARDFMVLGPSSEEIVY